MDRSRKFTLLRRMTVSLTLAALSFAGSVAAQAPQSTFAPAGPIAQAQRDLMMTALWIIIPVFLVVAGGILYAVVRFRSRPGDGIPLQTHGNARLEVIWTVIPILLLIIIAVPTVTQIFALDKVPEGALEVRVVGHQWWWAFDYTDHDLSTANELRIPAGKPVHLTMTSNDVIHSFWVPRLAGKLDVIPNRQTRMWIQADEPGIYYGQCAEYCGTSHANMRFRVIALPQEEFDAWIAERKAAKALAPSEAVAARGLDVFTGMCSGCHTVDGTSAQGKVGPDLSDLGSRTTLAAGIVDNTPENLAAWLRDPQAVKPGALMPKLPLSDGDIDALVGFLSSLK